MHKKLSRWILWLISGFGLLLLVVLVGAWFYTQTDQFRSTLRARLLAALNDSLNAEVSFKEVAGSIWGKLDFHDLAIVQNGVPVLSAPTVSIELGILGQLFPLLTSSAIHVGQIEISQPELWVAQDQDEKWNILTLLKEREPEEPGRFAIYLDEIKINNGKIEITTAEGKQARITSLSTKGELALLRSGAEVDFDYLNFALAATGIPNLSWASAFSFKDSGKTSLLDIQRLELATNKSNLKVNGTVRDLAEPTVALTIDLMKVSAEEITEMLPTLPLRQDVSGRLRASGPSSKLQLSGDLKAPDGQIVTSMVADLKSKPNFQGMLEVKGFALEKVLTVPGFSGRANAQISFAGSSLEQAQASARGTISQAAINGWELGEVALSGQLANKNASFAAQAVGKGGRADLKGTVALLETPAYEVTFNARALNLKKAAGEKPPVTANINLDAWTKGRGTEPKNMEVDTRITFYPSQVGAIQIQQGRAEGGVRAGALIVREARLVADGATLIAKGNIASLKQNATGNITYSLNVKDISPWLQLAGLEGSGSAKVEGSVGGSLQSPRLEGQASLSEMRMAKAYLQNGNIRWTLAGTGSNQWRGQVKLGAKQVTAGISLHSLDADLSLDGLRPATVGADITARDVDQRVHRMKTRLVHSGTRTEVLLQEIALQLANGGWRNPRPARVVVEGKSVAIEDFSLQHGTQSLTAKGTTGWEGAQNLYVQVNRFPLEDVGSFTKNAPELAGVLSLTLQVKGTAAQPFIEGGVNAESLTVAGQQYAGLTGQASYQKERLSVDFRLMQDKSHDLTAKGVLPVYLGWGGSKSPAVTGDADLRIHSDGLSPSFLAVLTKDVDSLQGTLSMDILLRGPINALAPRGTIQFQNGGARVVPLGLALKEIGLQANVTPGTIELTRFAARSGEGQLSGTGRLGLKQYSVTGMGFTLNAEQFQVINTREYKALASGKLVASGTFQQPMVRGALTVKGTLRPDLALMKRSGHAAQDPTIIVVRNEKDLAAAEEKVKQGAKAENGAGNTQEQSSFVQQLRLDITAELARGTWLYLDEGSIEVTGQLRIRKQPKENLTLAGNLQGLHGWYSFQGRRFRVEKAEATFTGGSQIDPTLDIVGRYRVPQYQIYVVIGGNMSKPTLTLRSDPQLDQADILSVLLFGKPVTALSQGEQNALQKQALKATADYFASGLKQSVARRLGVDTLEFGTGDNLTQGQVEVGKYVRDDVFVSATQQFGGESEQEYAVEYDVAPNWQIKSSTTSQGKSGIDLFWKKQY